MSNYTFFGTCANDHNHTKLVLKTIISQTIKPKDVILIDSGKKNNMKELSDLFDAYDINLIYLFKQLSRVEALNLAIENISTEFCMRFDTRTRFSNTYAEEALKILKDEKLGLFFIGGVPEVIPEKISYSGLICSEIMRRAYVFFYPRHRQIGYSGFSSSIYLGCFKTEILKKIKYRKDVYLISEDSLLASDYVSKNYKLWLSSCLKLEYVSRASVFNTLRLFNTYGYCRFNSIVLSWNVHSKKRYLSALILCFSYFTITNQYFPFNLLIFPVLILIINIYGELTFRNINKDKNKNKNKNYIVPLFATICQLSWGCGFIWASLVSFRLNKKKSNFIT